MTKVYIVKINPCGKKTEDTAALRKKAYGLVREKLGFSGEFERTENGKPYAGGTAFFNISHSGSFAAIAVSDCEVGVDIERIRNVNLGIAEKFSGGEREYIQSAENPQKAFFEIWTAKEAYLKKCGTGLTVPLDSFSVIGMTDIYRFFYEDCLISVCSKEAPQFCGLRQDGD